MGKSIGACYCPTPPTMYNHIYFISTWKVDGWGGGWVEKPRPLCKLTQTKRKISFEISPRALLRALIGWFVKLCHLVDSGTINHLGLASLIFSLMFATPALALISSVPIISILFFPIILSHVCHTCSCSYFVCPDHLNPLISSVPIISILFFPIIHLDILISRAKTIKKNTNSTQNKFQTHRAKQYKVTSFLSTDCELSTETCSKNV